MQGIMRDKTKAALRKRRQIVIHDVQVQALEVGNFSWKMEGDNLPLPILRKLGPEREALNDQAAFRRAIAVASDSRVRRDALAFDRQPLNCSHVVAIEAGGGGRGGEERG